MQCRDDAVTTDVSLVSLLRQHGAGATFNLNAGLHARERHLAGITRASSSGGSAMTNCARSAMALPTTPLPTRTPSSCRSKRRGARSATAARLQDLFDQPVRDFVYPFGPFDEAVAQAVRDAGHLYARTTRAAQAGLDAIDAMAAAPSCDFLVPDFWQQLDRARPAGAFWFWDHSCAPVDEAMWTAFEASVAHLCAEPGIQWCDPTDLFDGDSS